MSRLHQSLQSYRVRGALVEQEIFGRMEQIRSSYLKLLGEVASLRLAEGEDSELAAEPPTSRASEVRASLLALTLEKSPKRNSRGEESGSAMRPQKRLRGHLDLEEVGGLRSQVAEIAAEGEAKKQKPHREEKEAEYGQGPSG
ncbi:uncharacterized protein A4U43_UnF5080 [Asparagus officinalis]|uniref:Uncharacterized protein n=1 Tax=Asparagus officinalis TaxID=4686 RepID=A0A1R3L6R5_ASPOF|nr:uncharacterized protein A4U43_UnF5080 [Asparagus officinalis]